MHIVAINGFKRSGKGTVANFIADQLDGESFVYQIGFADKLKRLAALTLGIEGGPLDHIRWADDFKQTGLVVVDGVELTGREYLQNLGNEARSLFGEQFWVDQVLPYPTVHQSGMDTLDHTIANNDTMEQMYPGVDVLLITDLRYENEAQRVRSLGGLVWEVTRPAAKSDGHASEQPLDRDLIDATIKNEGDLDDLAAVVAALVEDRL